MDERKRKLVKRAARNNAVARKGRRVAFATKLEQAYGKGKSKKS